MSARWDENLDKAYEYFRQDHEALRDSLLASLPATVTREKRIGAAHRLRRITGGLTMNSKLRKIAIAAAILVVVLVGLHYLGGSPVGTTVAWADVLARMDAAQTVTFAFGSEQRGENGEQWWGKGTIRIKGPYRRYDGTCGLRYPGEAGNEETRLDIVDLSRQNRFIMFYPRKKCAFTADDHGGNDTLLTYDGLTQNFRDGTEEDLGRREIDGREAVCFKVTKGNEEITVWADPDTALPLRIERSATDRMDKSILSDIRFDVELEDRLFDMTVPKDCVAVNMSTDEFTFPFELTEKHLVEGLATFAKSRKGKFPTLFMGGRPGQEAMDKNSKEGRTAVPIEDSFSGMLAAEYVKRLPDGSQWQYMGEDVQLGDAKSVVFWYQRPGSATCRTIYGDLTVRDVAPDDLPQAPWPPKQR